MKTIPNITTHTMCVKAILARLPEAREQCPILPGYPSGTSCPLKWSSLVEKKHCNLEENLQIATSEFSCNIRRYTKVCKIVKEHCMCSIPYSNNLRISSRGIRHTANLNLILNADCYLNKVKDMQNLRDGY